MTTIDHRILIPANPTVVWDYISNLSRNPKWQVDCRSVTFLTGKHEGPGTRWRTTTESGRDYVLEVTAWYNGLGYEYVYIDGPAYEENIGRIRLQEIPEGTIVQWTFTYALPGMLGGLRDSLGARRQIDKTIADSLRKLYLQVKAYAGSSAALEAKSLMRDAPNAEARSHYQPRHPSATKDPKEAVQAPLPPKTVLPIIDEPPISDDDAQTLRPFAPITQQQINAAPPPIIPEPPPAHEDTRPNPIIKISTAEAEAIPPQTEPDFDFDFESGAAVVPTSGSALDFTFDDDDDVPINAPPIVSAEPPVDPLFDTQPRPVTPAPSLSAEAAEPPAPHQSREIPAYHEPTLMHSFTPPSEDSATASFTVEEQAPPAKLVPQIPDIEAPPAEPAAPLPSAPEPEATRSVSRTEAPTAPEVAPVPSEPPPPTPMLKPWEEPTISPSATASQPSAMDTANISIWEIFGVQRPSETQQIKAVVAPTPEPPAPTIRPDMSPMRMGLRMALRRSRKSIRRIKPM